MRSTPQVLGVQATSAFLCLSLALLFLSALGSAASAQCVASFREIKFADGSARVKNYVCKSEGAAKPDIRVEFDRLSEAAAGNLIQREPYPELDKAFGKVRLIDNTVGAEAKKLFDQFGVKSLEETCYAFQVASAAGGKGYENNADSNCGKRAMWYITFPDREDLTTLNFPLPADIEYYQANSDWPHGYGFFYKGSEYCEGDTSPIYCTTIWRPANAGDIANYEANKVAYDKALGLDDYTPEQIAQDVESGESADLSGETDASADIWANAPKRYFSLVNYLTREGFPGDFLFITGEASECGGGIDFSIHIRQMVLDVAFIQNISSKPVSLDGLLGSETAATNLRATAAGGASGPLALGADKIRPGETVAVPLAISFVMAGSLKNQFVNPAEAAKTYQRIQSSPAGSMIELKDDTAEPPVVVKKSRESFGAPTAPKPATYFYGPEIALKGLVVAGKPIVFDQASRNFMQLTAGEGYGSCPYLYSWDEDDKAWVRHGKVIDAANNQAKEMTETKTIPGFRSKFRLAEEELEVSYIDHVKLEVELKDGGGMTLAPDFAPMTAKDGSYATIKAGDRIEFSFALPSAIKAEDVKQSTLAVTGYYRRYSDLFMALQ
jgi:hypothetical protein